MTRARAIGVLWVIVTLTLFMVAANLVDTLLNG